MFGSVKPIGPSCYALCGCYFFSPSSPQPEYLPLVKSEAHTTILSTSSKTVLRQTYSNSTFNKIEECVYTFPLYDGVGVVGFTCKVGSKTLTGLVKEKHMAKKTFDDAVAKGQTAGLLQQTPQASDVWATKIGNIPIGQSVVVETTYIGELKHTESDGVRFTIPTRIAPRYGSGLANTITPNAKEEGGIKITVDVSMPGGSTIRSIDSPSHQIKVSMGIVSTAAEANPTLSKASATLSLGSTALEKDFILVVQSKDVGVPKAILETHPDYPNHRAIMATLVPKFSIPPIRPEIVFVADRSGSMRDNMPMLVSAMKVFLKSMPSGVKFNICSFGSSNSFLWPKSKSYSGESLDLAMNHLNTFDANMGGTETYRAIEATIDKRFGDIPLEVIVLTDGDIWQQESLFAYVNEQVESSKGNIRVFTLGIGNGVSSALIEGLARAGNGFAQSVQDGERLDSSVVRMLRGSLSPHVTNYTLEVKYEAGDDGFELIERPTDSMKLLPKEEKQPSKPASVSLFNSSIDEKQLNTEMENATANLPNIPYPKLLQAPHNIPSLFAFSRTTIYLIMSPETPPQIPKSVILRGTTTEGIELNIEIPVEVLSTPARTIHQLAAKKAVQDLEEGRGWIFDAKDAATGALVKDKYPSTFSDLVKKEAVRLGEKFQVAGKWCSFVAVVANDDVLTSKRPMNLGDGDDDFEIIETPNTDSSSPFYGQRARPAISRAAFGAIPPPPAAPAATTTPQYAAPSVFFSSSATNSASSNFSPHPFGEPQPKSRSRVAQPSSGGLFSGAAQQSSGLFGTAQPSGDFGSAHQQSSNSLFSSTTQSSGGFGGAAQQSSGLFGSTAKSSGGFGGTAQQSGGGFFGAAQQSIHTADTSNFPGPIPSTSNVGMVGMAFGEQGRNFGTTSATPRNYFPIDWASKSITEKVLAVIELQQFDGSWKPSPELSTITGFDKLRSSTTDWTTMFMVCWLEIKCASEEATFEMVVEKAREWLVANVPGLEDLENEISMVVKDS